MVIELLCGKKGLRQASRDYGIKDTILSRRKQEFLEWAPQAFKGEKVEDYQAEKWIAELERRIAQLTLEVSNDEHST